MVVFESSALLTAHPYLQRKTYALDMDGGAHRMRKCSVISQAGLQVSEFAVLSKLGLLGAEATGVVGRRYLQLVDLPWKMQRAEVALITTTARATPIVDGDRDGVSSVIT
ncbi:hypothetical protein [Rhizobium ruizarguesonis]|uniref:hypothetical protein n=1 Tax=Rhizobium ruizarguesonis TaxID=2081791 RepID=UPI00143F9551|nr:hypothetical protein [Rhizobium ruizarguesonis]